MKIRTILALTMVMTLLSGAALLSPARADAPPAGPRPITTQADNPNPPDTPVKLIFVHHSTGGNWLADPNGDQPYGGLGLALRDSNYYVSATNYGWGPNAIGDRTDIPNWPEWFTGVNRDPILSALYLETGQNFDGYGDWSRLTTDPGGQNEIIMFKSCFPNSVLDGNATDDPLPAPNDYDYTVANAKAVYNNILTYFATHPEKLFVVITAPPRDAGNTTPQQAANARAFNIWLMQNWLAEAGYTGNNVAVFDYYNVLTDPGNHHRYNGGVIEYVTSHGNNTLYYPGPDGEHPSSTGHQKATAEFVPLLNVFYHRWQAGSLPPAPALNLTAPNGGEHWPVNTSQQIRWTTTSTVTRINLYYAINSVTTTIELNVANTGVYTWTTPAAATSLARVRVESVISPTTVYDTSRTDFTLCEPDNCAYLFYLPVILKEYIS